MPTGVYLSVPFCRSKCSYCNFASGVFSQSQFARYVERACAEFANAQSMAQTHGAQLDSGVDTVYLGGGTPTTLAPEDLCRLFAHMRQSFAIAPAAEITVECAPGTLDEAVLAALVASGVNRISFGVQSFVDREAAAVGRLHTRDVTLADIARLRAAGITNINLDLIAGLPHQTAESWEFSVSEVIATGVPHVSVYMLEVDEDSRLGREVMAGGTRYHAHFVPDDAMTIDFYEVACQRLNAAGIAQYEISNFARPGFESRHNLKYWTRQPYLGVGVDAHSMLGAEGGEAVRIAKPDTLDGFLYPTPLMPPVVTRVSRAQALEERFFLGLRLNQGVSPAELEREFGAEAMGPQRAVVARCVAEGLLEEFAERVRLTPRGRLVSNEVFERFLE